MIDGQSRCGTSHSGKVRSTGRRDTPRYSPTPGCRVDAWETTYIHELTGENPVLQWITGTALTPVKSRLDRRRNGSSSARN